MSTPSRLTRKGMLALYESCFVFVLLDFCVFASCKLSINCLQTYVFMEMFSTSRSEKYFKDPMEMKPERWLRGNKDENEGNKDENLAFSNLQFGFGTRMCLGEKDQLVKLV